MRSTAVIARTRHAGFSLLELLIAMTIVGVLSTMVVVMATPGEGALAKTEARRLAALLELALAETRAGGQSIAWSPERGGYSFWHRADDGAWVRFPDRTVYGRRSLPGATQLHDVFIDAQELAEGERVVMSPYGFRGALEATMSGGNAKFVVRGGVLGRVSVQPGSHEVTEARRLPARPRVHPG